MRRNTCSSAAVIAFVSLLVWVPSASAGGIWEGYIDGIEFGNDYNHSILSDDWLVSSHWEYDLGAPKNGYWYINEPRDYEAATTYQGQSDIVSHTGPESCRAQAEQHYKGEGSGTMSFSSVLDGENRPDATYEVIFSDGYGLMEKYEDCEHTTESSSSLADTLGFPGLNGVGWWPKGTEDLNSAKELKGVSNTCATPDLPGICSQTIFEFHLNCVEDPEDLNANCVRDSAESGADPCESGQHGYASHKWSARVQLPAIPDAHLFHFSVSLPYCYNGSRARVRGPGAVGTVDYGFGTGLLEALGFETVYDYAKEHVYASDFGTAELTGSFAITFEWLTLIDRLGVKKLVKQRIQNYLEHEIRRSILKFGYGKRYRRKVARWLAVSEKKILDEAKRRLGGVKPGFLRDWLEVKVLKKLEGYIDDWRGLVDPILSSRRAAHHAGRGLAGRAVKLFFKVLDPKSTFPVWNPLVKVSVSPDGQLSATEEDDYKHPALTVSEDE
jgi:hypothetical protein